VRLAEVVVLVVVVVVVVVSSSLLWLVLVLLVLLLLVPLLMRSRLGFSVLAAIGTCGGVRFLWLILTSIHPPWSFV
jgi:hypothetical protein